MRTITMGALFAGIGAPELAGERHGITTLWASEIDPQAASVHARHFPRTYQLGDIHHVGKHNAAPVDIVCGGSPCQDLSIAGNRAGLAGARSGLFHEYIRVIRELRPAFAIWENVPGALTSHAGRDFALVLRSFYDIGARDIAWRVLDAQYFGLAQRRKRVFAVIDFRGQRAGEILFEPESATGHRTPRKKPGADIAYALTGSNQRLNASNNETFIGIPQIAHTVKPGLRSTQDDGTRQTFIGIPSKTGTLRPGILRSNFPINNPGEFIVPSKTGTIRANGSGLQYASTNIPGDYLVPEKTGTLTQQSMMAHDKNTEGQFLIPESYRVRRLMPVECERLMGLPDNWTRWDAYGKELPDTPRYRMLGNSIAVPVMEWILRRMVEVLS